MAARAVVIGGGITGTLTALALRRAGFAVALVEAAHIGAGSSSRTAAGIRQQFSTPETVLGMRYSVAFYRDFPAQVGGDAVPIQQNGYLFLLGTGEALAAAEARVAVQRAAGLREVELLRGAEARARFPFLAEEGVVGATFCPTDGFLRPEVVYQEAADAGRRAGVSLMLRAPVRGARHDGRGALAAVLAGADWVEGDVFIDATNAWSPRLGAALGATPLPIAPTKRYLWFLPREDALPAQVFASLPLIIAPDGTYCRPENAGSLLLGRAHAAPPEPDFSADDQDRVEPAFDHRAGPDGFAVDAWARVAAVVPDFAALGGIHATTCGYYGTTPDHNPFFGFDPAVPNLIRLAGFSGHGAMFGPFTARVGAALAAAGRDLDAVPVLDGVASLAPFRIGRPFDTHEHLVI